MASCKLALCVCVSSAKHYQDIANPFKPLAREDTLSILHASCMQARCLVGIARIGQKILNASKPTAAEVF